MKAVDFVFYGTLAIFVLTAIVIVACRHSGATTSHEMQCERVAFGGVDNGYRCENDEAVCYQTAGSSAAGISCWRK